ncbi:MAG: rhodanese-like domain-containing protein [Saprospiraceae bacterium]|nr:rhodanese-like domain-containing protein [Saprospiraceae bacterium]
MRFHTFILLLFAVFSFSACSDNTDNNSTNNSEKNSSQVIETLNPKDFKKKLTEFSDAQLIDVRTAGEHETGNVENSINIDFRGTDFKEKLATLDKEQPVFVYCQAGGRSSKSAKVCKELGFKKVYDMSGGYSQWSQMTE